MVSTVEPFVTAESIFHISAEHKSGYNIWCRWNIGILTSYSESTWKTGPGDISYVIFLWGFTYSIFGNNARNGYCKGSRHDMREPSSYWYLSWNFASNGEQIITFETSHLTLSPMPQTILAITSATVKVQINPHQIHALLEISHPVIYISSVPKQITWPSPKAFGYSGACRLATSTISSDSESPKKNDPRWYINHSYSHL